MVTSAFGGGCSPLVRAIFALECLTQPVKSELT